MKQYHYRKGTTCSVPVEIVGPELERIWAEHAEQLTPTDIVAAARLKDSPLHPCFEWNNSVAGEKYRLFQARNLTRNVQVVVEGEEPKTLFVHVRVDRQGKTQQHYQHIDVILDKPGEYFAGLAELRQKLVAITEAFEALKRHAEIHAAADSELQKLGAIVEALITARTVAERLQ